MKRLFLAFFVLILSWGSAQTYVQLVLDASGSMWNKLEDGTYRITAAKDVLNDFIKGLPSGDLNVGLRVYGATTNAVDDGACDDIQLVVPMEGVDKAALQTAVETTTAKGATPIVKALELAAEDFPAEATKKLIVLVTDGEESCGGDLEGVAEKLKAQGIAIDLKVVGFALDADAQESFAGVGEFVNAADAEELASALETAVQEVVVTQPEPEMVERQEVTLTAPATAPAGQSLEVAYNGPDLSPDDFVTIVLADSADDSYQDYTFVNLDTKTLTLNAPIEPGNYEVRYLDENNTVLARAPLVLEASAITFDFPDEVMAGSDFQVAWTGPNGVNDYIAIVPADAPEGSFRMSFYTADANPGTLTAPIEAGEYEVRYSTERSEDGGKIFHRQAITAFPAIIEFTAPAEVAVGESFEVAWTGPSGKDDYITIVPTGSPEGTYKSYFYTASANPGQLTAPDAPGQYELRYSSDNRINGGKIFYSVPITVK